MSKDPLPVIEEIEPKEVIDISPTGITAENFRDYVAIDDNLPIEGDLSDAALCAEL